MSNASRCVPSNARSSAAVPARSVSSNTSRSSSTSRLRRSRSTAASAASLAACCESSASATTICTRASAAVLILRSGTNQTPSRQRLRACCQRAVASASAVLPMPPGPWIATQRARVSSLIARWISRARPTNGSGLLTLRFVRSQRGRMKRTSPGRGWATSGCWWMGSCSGSRRNFNASCTFTGSWVC